jgi:hypothetical protein
MPQAPIRVAAEHPCLGVQRDSERDVPELRAGLPARRNRFHEERQYLSKGSRFFPRTAEMTTTRSCDGTVSVVCPPAPAM